MKYHVLNTFLLLLMLCQQKSIAQVQLVKGRVFDKKTEESLVGANIIWVGSSPVIGSTTDADGKFTLSLPYGRHKIAVQYIGYQSFQTSDLLVTAGKEVILDLGLEESITKLNEVVVSSQPDKTRTVNEMASISGKSFSIDEVLRYSGSRNDVARMAANFAGVFIANDQRNDLVIRGNSPTGVLYRIEGVNVPNPNHFATLGTTGGPVSAINPNMLKRSDFLTGAFPAEYGNATAGVFDIGFKTGNKEKYEFTTQLAAFSGLEAMVEGPISRTKNQSFVLAYRHSLLGLLDAFKINIGVPSIPQYNDLSFKIDLGKTPIGKINIWGLGGTSRINTSSSSYGKSYAQSKLGTIGFDHRFLINNTTSLKTVIAYSGALSRFDNYVRDSSDSALTHDYLEKDMNKTFSFISTLNKKIDARHHIRAGISADIYSLDANSQSLKNTTWVSNRDFMGKVSLLQTYIQSQYKITEQLTFNSGLHLQYLTLNQKSTIEPRLALNWTFMPQQSVNIGYGLHSQMQPLPIYLEETAPQYQGDIYHRTNTNLDFTKSQHVVLGYQIQFANNWSLKTDAYYQYLYNVPVEQQKSAFSLLNYGASFGFPSSDSLVGKGKGQNYGLELTLEKTLSKGYYSLLTASLFDAKYKGSDDISRNTAFNNQYIVNLLIGKEFKINSLKDDVVTLDFKMTYAGGRYYTPIDLVKSQKAGSTVYDNSLIMAERFSPFFRVDAKVGYRLNDKKHKIAHYFFGEVQNLTNHANPFSKVYDIKAQKIKTTYQISIFFDLMYRVQF